MGNGGEFWGIRQHLHPDLPHIWWALGSVELSLELFGAQVAERGMASRSVVPAFNPFADAGSRLLVRAISHAVDQLALESAEEALHHGVVITVAGAAHAAGDVEIVQCQAVLIAGVLHAAVGVMQQLAIGGEL